MTRILAISGSLRRESFNTRLIVQAQRLAPAGLAIERFDLAPIPLYNEDVNAVGLPAPVAALRQAIAQADGLLIATPEYNYSIPGVLKNAIDWVSRPPAQPLAGKPIALMGASAGQFGTARAQYHLRQVFVLLNGLVMNQPELMIGPASGEFAADGTLKDPATNDRLAKFLAAFTTWVTARPRSS